MIFGLRRVFFAVSLVVTAAAIVWWWQTFGFVVQYGYLSWPEASRCLISDNDICSLAKVLCFGEHPRQLVAYWASAFWIGVILLSLSLWLNGARAASTPASP